MWQDLFVHNALLLIHYQCLCFISNNVRQIMKKNRVIYKPSKAITIQILHLIEKAIIHLVKLTRIISFIIQII
jgi:hypothetical protein